MSDMASSDPSPPASARSSRQAELTPGQHLLAITAAFFNGGGWADPLTWENFDDEGHARWEAKAEKIGRNLRLATAAEELLVALTAVDRQTFCDCLDDGRTDHEPGCFVPLLKAAVAKALSE
jgi:hypothetical protein